MGNISFLLLFLVILFDSGHLDLTLFDVAFCSIFLKSIEIFSGRQFGYLLISVIR